MAQTRKVWVLAAVALTLGGAVALPAAAQKAGGILRSYNSSNPPSASIHEEATVATVMPFSAVFNNLLMYDASKPRNSLDTVVPELAESWAWDASRTRFTVKLRKGVKWHDGKPFTAKDVQCTWNKLLGKDADALRKNPRAVWWRNLKEVTISGDFEATFVLARPQAALPALIASNYSPVYPCHVPAKDMRTKPVGTGPFKFVEFKANESIKVTRNPDYWKKGRPYLDGIEYTIITNRSTAILAFVAGKIDMMFPTEVSIPLLKDVKRQLPRAVCEVAPTNVNTNLIVNRDSPPFNSLDLRTAMALTLDRKAFAAILYEGRADIGGAMLPGPEGNWGLPAEIMAGIPGYGADVKKNRDEARKLMQKAGYGPAKRLKIKVSTRNIAVYRDPAVILIDQLKEIYIDGELEVVETANWFSKVARKDYTIGLNLTGNAVDDPDQTFYENYSCGSERNYTNYCNKDLQKLFDQQSMELDRDKRKKLVWEIDKKLQEDVARPTILHNPAATCWQPIVKGMTLMVNSIYNGYRYEDVWLDR